MSDDTQNDDTSASRSPAVDADGPSIIVEIDDASHDDDAFADAAPPLSRPPPKPTSRPPAPSARPAMGSSPAIRQPPRPMSSQVPRPIQSSPADAVSIKPLKMISLGDSKPRSQRPPSSLDRTSNPLIFPGRGTPLSPLAERSPAPPSERPPVPLSERPPPPPPPPLADHRIADYRAREALAPPAMLEDDDGAVPTPRSEEHHAIPAVEEPSPGDAYDAPTPPPTEDRDRLRQPLDSAIDLDRVTPPPQPTRRSPPPPPSTRALPGDIGPDIEVGSAEIDVAFDSAPGKLEDEDRAPDTEASPHSEEEAIPVSETEPLTADAVVDTPPQAPPVTLASGAVELPRSLDDADKASTRKPPPPPPPKRPRPSGPPPSGDAVAQALEAPRFEPPTKPRAKPWWEELFTDDFGRGIMPLSEAQVKREATFIEESLGVAKGGAVLDLGCGAGHHATELARRGYGVVGFDLSLPQLALAGEYAQERGQKINFLQGDMRDMSFDEVFDGIYCWNTSFGYFEEEKNVLVAERVFKALRPGGSFLLDVINRDFVVEHQPSQVWFEGDACVCMDDMSVDFITSRLRVKRTMMLDDGRTKECSFSIRVYSLHELGKLLHEIGFKVTEASGHVAYPGVFFGATSPRIVILAQKP
jgi:SAM-dependent methyltransferase